MSRPSIPRPLVRVNQWFIVISVVLTWLTGQYWLLLLPLLAGIAGLTTGYNPVIRFSRRFLRQPASSYVPEDGDDQQFNQTLAVGFLAVAFIGYLLQWQVVAYLFSIFVALAAIIAILGFCVGCFVRFHILRLRRSFRS